MADGNYATKELLQAKVDAIDATIAGLRTEAELRQEVIETRLKGMDLALQEKGKDLDKNFGYLNNLRQEVSDDRGNLVRTDIFEAKIKWMWTTLIAFVMLIFTALGVIVALLKH